MGKVEKAIWFPANRIKKMKVNRAGVAAFKNIGRYDWILFTSKNTVTFFMDEMRLRHLKVPRSSKSSKIAAVGPETARALKSAGLKVDLMPKKFSAKHLVSALGAKVAGKRVLFPRSAIGFSDPVRELRAKGAGVDVVHLYTTLPVPIPRGIISAIKKGTVDYIVFTSSSAVTSFIKKMREKKMKGIAAKVALVSAVCIGPSTAAAARVFPFKKIHIAKTSTKAGIASLLRNLP